MKTNINSVKGKYTVNMLMTLVFLALAYSGFFRGGERGHFPRSGNGSHAFRDNEERHSLQNPGSLEQDFYMENFTPVLRDKGMDFHTIAGLIWLVFMALHIWQHRSWYKKWLLFRNIRNNKMLSFTILIFILLSLSGISLAFHLIPRELLNVREIHEPLSQLMGILTVIHIVQRYNWIVTTTKRLVFKFRLSVTNA